MAAVRKVRLGETVIFIDGAKREAAIVTEVFDGQRVHLKVLPPRKPIRGELDVIHRKDATQSDDRFWTRVDEDRA